MGVSNSEGLCRITFHRATLVYFACLSVCLLLAGCEKTDNRYVRNSADAAHARIGVITGSTPAQLAHERFPGKLFMTSFSKAILRLDWLCLAGKSASGLATSGIRITGGYRLEIRGRGAISRSVYHFSTRALEARLG